MRAAIWNVIKVLAGIALAVLGLYSVVHGFSGPTRNPNLFFLGGLFIVGIGMAIIIYVIKKSKN